jgi:hypothetical protein
MAWEGLGKSLGLSQYGRRWLMSNGANALPTFKVPLRRVIKRSHIP